MLTPSAMHAIPSEYHAVIGAAMVFLNRYTKGGLQISSCFPKAMDADVVLGECIAQLFICPITDIALTFQPEVANGRFPIKWYCVFYSSVSIAKGFLPDNAFNLTSSHAMVL